MPKKKKQMEIKNYDNIVNAKLGLDMWAESEHLELGDLVEHHFTILPLRLNRKHLKSVYSSFFL